jgi:hypothetical protein
VYRSTFILFKNKPGVNIQLHKVDNSVQEENSKITILCILEIVVRMLLNIVLVLINTVVSISQTQQCTAPSEIFGVVYLSYFKLQGCWLHTQTPVTYSSKLLALAQLPPGRNTNYFGYILQGTCAYRE